MALKVDIWLGLNKTMDKNNMGLDNSNVLEYIGMLLDIVMKIVWKSWIFQRAQ